MERETLSDRLRIATGGRNARQVADAVGMNHETVRRYLNGHSPSVDFLARVCEVYAVNGEWLLIGKGPSSPSELLQATLRTASQADLLGSLASRLMAMDARLTRLEQSLEKALARASPETGTQRLATNRLR